MDVFSIVLSEMNKKLFFNLQHFTAIDHDYSPKVKTNSECQRRKYTYFALDLALWSTVWDQIAGR